MSRMQFLSSLLCVTAFSFLPSAHLPADPLRAPDASPGIIASSAVSPAASGPEDIRDIRGPVELPEAPPYGLYAAGIALALAAAVAGYLLLRRRRRRPAPAVDPAALALVALRQAEYLEGTDEPDRFAATVSEIIKRYLEQRFELPVTTRTTAEFFRQLKTSETGCPEPLAPHLDQLRKCLALCDLVKYAKHQPEQTTITTLAEQTRSFIETTRTKPE